MGLGIFRVSKMLHEKNREVTKFARKHWAEILKSRFLEREREHWSD